jgi:ABC-type antimicrobial peptide transport system permease subunit
MIYKNIKTSFQSYCNFYLIGYTMTLEKLAVSLQLLLTVITVVSSINITLFEHPYEFILL